MDEDKPKVVQAQMIQYLKDNWVAHLESTALGARMTRARYLALVKEGFTEAQAIELCKG